MNQPTVKEIIEKLSKYPEHFSVNIISEQDIMGIIITPLTGEIQHREGSTEVDLWVVSSC